MFLSLLMIKGLKKCKVLLNLGMNQLMWYYADLEKQKCYHMKDFPDLPDFDNQEKACSIWRRFAKYVTIITTTLKKLLPCNEIETWKDYLTILLNFLWLL